MKISIPNEQKNVRNGGFVAVQTESEPEVRSLLDDLGLREKQQFVRVFYFVHCNL
jgi:hypothetical protein